MAVIRPFKGLLYGKGKIGGEHSSVVAPPYDVIPDQLKEQLYSKNPYNIIRLILGKSEPGDNENSNWYTRAAGFLEAWQKEGVLVRDSAESFYVYLQEYPYRGKVRRRLGFIGLMKIEEGGEDRVLPHENTLAKPKEDRMNLIKRVASNLSPIFALYNGTSGSGASIRKILEDCMASQVPDIDVKADDERERVWRLSDEAAVKKIVSLMGDKRIFIADGHHRYEVAKAYRDARRQKEGYDGSADHVMMYFTDMADTDNLTVMATHRVVKEMPFSGDDEVRERLAEYFDARECSGIEELVDALEGSMDERYSFGYFGGGKHLLFMARDMDKVFGLMKDDKTREWKLLDVSILHSAVLKALLGASDREGNITYVRDADKGRDLVKDGSHMAAFFLRPTRVDQVRAVAEVGDKMPQKSTYFYPKLLSGLVINKLR
jgi:uncharacterized protein (DUF1015 family)